MDLEDLQPSGSPDSNLKREISVYRLAANAVEPWERAGMIRDLLHRASAPDEWPAEQARWVAVELLMQYNPFDQKTGDQREFDSGRALIESAIKHLDQEHALDAFRDVAVLARTDPSDSQKGREFPNWCWTLLNQLAELRPEGATSNLQFELGWELADQEREDRLRRSLALIDNYEKILAHSGMDEKDQSKWNDLVDFARAKANGKREYMRECFRRCVAVGFRAYEEDAMARFLLTKLGR
jgi:hypothetical protein